MHTNTTVLHCGGRKLKQQKKNKKPVNEAQFGVKTRHTKPTHITYPGPAG